MQFDPNNKIIKLCADGNAAEGKGDPEMALSLFLQAWNEAGDPFEKFNAAHFGARHQKTETDKLKWDEMALKEALKADDADIKSTYPSQYLNIGKCYEDLQDPVLALENYKMAASYQEFLTDDGYGKRIRSVISYGLERILQNSGNIDPGSKGI